MTQKEFFEVLSTIEGWKIHLRTNACIRRNVGAAIRIDKASCPITAVCMEILKRKFPSGDYSIAGHALGLRDDFIRNIQQATDGCFHQNPQYKRYRTRLLKACNLKEG